MNIKIQYLLFYVLILISTASAQKNMVIYHVTGSVNVITNDKGNPAIRGGVISTNNYLQVKPNASCMLIATGGKSVQVSEAGTYSYKQLQALLSKDNSDQVTKKFLAYVYDNFFISHKNEPLGVTPVVFRGERLMLLPSDFSIILSDAITFTWKKPVIKTPLRMVIRDEAKKIVMDTIIRKANSLHVNVEGNLLIPGHVYEWKMEESDTHQPKDYYLHFLVARKKEAKKIMQEMNLLRNKKLTSQLKEQMQADIYEKWHRFYANSSENAETH